MRGLVQLGMEGNAVRSKRGTIGTLMFAVVGMLMLLILLSILYGLSTGHSHVALVQGLSFQ